jgi:XisH protein
MPAKDLYHDIVVEALTADGWTITDDPLYLSVESAICGLTLALSETPSGRKKKGKGLPSK